MRGMGAGERSLIRAGLPSVGDDDPLFYPVIRGKGRKQDEREKA